VVYEGIATRPFDLPGSHIVTFIRPAVLGALAGALLGIGAVSAQNAPRLLESRESPYNNIYVF
jgi:hypothetical protein